MAKKWWHKSHPRIATPQVAVLGNNLIQAENIFSTKDSSDNSSLLTIALLPNFEAFEIIGNVRRRRAVDSVECILRLDGLGGSFQLSHTKSFSLREAAAEHRRPLLKLIKPLLKRGDHERGAGLNDGETAARRCCCCYIAPNHFQNLHEVVHAGNGTDRS